MKQSGTTAHIVLAFIGASTFVSPLTRNTVMKAGQAGKFDRDAGEKLKARQIFDSTGKTSIPYFREEAETADYAFDFTAAWAKAGNTPRVSDLNNKPLVAETASPQPGADPSEPVGTVVTEGEQDADTQETATETTESQESTETDTGAAGGEGTESQESSEEESTDEESDETSEETSQESTETADGKKATDEQSGDATAEKPAAKTTQRRSRTK